ncbi:MAG: DUF3379 family protein [Dongiaceae bacterium]
MLGDPLQVSEEMVRHEAECATCHGFAVETRKLETFLRNAVAIEPPETLEARALLTQILRADARTSRRQIILRVAASLVGTIAVGAIVASVLRDRLPAEIIAHSKPGNFGIGRMASADQVTHVLQSIGRTSPGATLRVVYANNCVIADHLAAHLVLNQDGQSVNVFLMPMINVTATETFRADRYVGEVRAFHPGSIAVVAERVDELEPTYQLVAAALPD